MPGLLGLPQPPNGMTWRGYLDQRVNDPLQPNLSSRITQQDMINKGLLSVGMAPLGITNAVKWLYHGTGEGAFRNIKKQGLVPKNSKIYATDSLDYAKTYSARKGNPFGDRVLRMKEQDFAVDASNKGGDYIRKSPVAVEELEVLVNGQWVPLSKYSNPDIGIF